MESKAEENLRVEPFKLMHSGNFYGFLCDSWKDIHPSDIVYFGISTREFPETNSSISSYVHDERKSIYAIHHVPKHQATAVYKKGYHLRLGLSNQPILDHSLNDIIRTFKSQKMPFDYFGDQGLKSEARNVYNISEIESLICYNKDDLGLYQEITSRLGIRIPIYQEFENHEFMSHLDQNFVLINDDKIFCGDGDRTKEIIIPNSFEKLGEVTEQLENKIDEMIRSLKYWQRIAKDEYKSEYSESIKKYKLLSQRIEQISQEGKIPISEILQEKAKVLFSRLTRENGTPRYLYLLRS